MKKLFTLMFMFIMTMGIFTSVAQTTGTAAFGIDTFCEPLSKSGQSASSLGISKVLWQKLQNVKSDEAINSSLLKAGFKCTSRKKMKDYDDSIGEYVTYTEAQYSRTTSTGTIYVDLDWEGLHIRFPNAAEKNKFIATATSKGYRSQGGGAYQMAGNEAAYWVGVTLRGTGNSVYIFGGRG